MMPEPSASSAMIPSYTTAITSTSLAISQCGNLTSNGCGISFTSALSKINADCLSVDDIIPVISTTNVPDTVLMIASTYVSPRPTVDTTYTNGSLKPIIVSSTNTCSSLLKSSTHSPTLLKPYTNYLTEIKTHSTQSNLTVKERLDAALQTNGQYIKEEEEIDIQTGVNASNVDIKNSSDRDLLIQIFQNSLENKKQIQELHDKLNKVHDALFQFRLKSPQTMPQHFSKKRKKEKTSIFDQDVPIPKIIPSEEENIPMSQFNNNEPFAFNDDIDTNLSYRISDSNHVLPYSELSIEIPTLVETNLQNKTDFDAAPLVKQSIKSRKRNTSECTYFIRKMLSQEFSREELNQGGYTSMVKNYKNTRIVTVALSPNRLQKINDSAKERFPDEYETLSFPRIVNEKCRKTRLYKEKQRRTGVS